MQTTSATILLSKRGFKELHKKISELEHERNRLTSQLHEQDKSTTYDERLARTEKLSEFNAIEVELAKKRRILKEAKLLPTRRERLKVVIGSVVDLIDQQGRILRYRIVDSFEANPSDGRISIESPLGKSLLGKQIEEHVEWGQGHKHQRFQLVRIH